MTKSCGTCAHAYPNCSAVGVRLGCWQDKVASGFKYTFNLANDGKDCDTYKPKLMESKMKGIPANKVEEGAYLWKHHSMCYLGFIKRDSRGLLYGNFVAEDGGIRSVITDYLDGTFAEGLFFPINFTDLFNENTTEAKST